MSIEEDYNIWSKQYDINKNRTRDLDKINTIETLDKYNFNRVLELGCGTGKNTQYLTGRAKQIISLDFSQEMLNEAKKKVSDEKVSFRKADLKKDWDIEDDYADLVTSSLTLEHIDDLNHIFDQASKKLKKGAFFFISELHPFKQYSGSKARYGNGDESIELEVYIHHISEYTDTAIQHGFELIELKECFDDDNKNEIPRLISFVFMNSGITF